MFLPKISQQIEHRVAKSLGQTPVAVMGLGRAKCSPHQQQITAINQGIKDMAEKHVKMKLIFDSRG